MIIGEIYPDHRILESADPWTGMATHSLKIA